MGKELDFNFNLETAARRELKNKKNTNSGGEGLTESEVITLIQSNTSSYVTASDVTTQVSQEMSNYATVNDLSTLSNSIDTSLSSKADKSDIAADLTTDNDNKMLAASQGVALKTQVDNKSAKFQYDEMPISNAANSGKIIQYVGATTSVEPIYISGAFYRSTGSGWEIVLNPLATSDLSSALGTAATKNFTTNVEPNNHNLVESNAVYAAISSSLAAVYEPHGNITCAELTNSLLIAENVGNIYNITDSGTTDANFIGGAGQTISAGTVVSIVRTGVSTYKFNLTPGMIDLSTIQKKILENSVTVDGVAKTTVEAALSALATMTTSLNADLFKTDITSLCNINLPDYDTTHKNKVFKMGDVVQVSIASTTNQVVYSATGILALPNTLNPNLFQVIGTTYVNGNPHPTYLNNSGVVYMDIDIPIDAAVRGYYSFVV